jgi:hypothetical protein
VKPLLLRKNSWGLAGIAVLAGAVALAQAPTVAPKSTVVAPGNAKPLWDPDNSKVPVELEWEEVAGAKLYELEFRNLEGKKLNTFKSPNHIFKFKFRTGKYRVRARVADDRKVYGEWSEPQEFAVTPKPVKLPAEPVKTKGIIDKKTLVAEVIIHWGQAPGASQYRVKIVNEKDVVVKEDIVRGFYYKTYLQAGIYTTTLTSISAEGIESEPVTLPGKVVIETVQLDKPIFVLEEVVDPTNPKLKVQRLPQTGGKPTLKWKDPSPLADTVGTLEYRYFFGEEWIPVESFTSTNAKEVILEKSVKPGRYRINAWCESHGLKKSEATTYEFVVKPTAY